MTVSKCLLLSQPVSIKTIDMQIEQWRTIPDFPDYAASNFGRIKRITPRKNNIVKPEILKTHTDQAGYHVVTLMRQDGSWTPAKVHRCVLMAFCGRPPKGKNHCAHCDGNKNNNNVENLKWKSAAQNYADQVKHGTDNVHERNGMAKLTFKAAEAIRAKRNVGWSWQKIADHFMVSVRCCRNVVAGKTWKV